MGEGAEIHGRIYLLQGGVWYTSPNAHDVNRRRDPLVRPPANLLAVGGAVQFRLPDGIDLNNILPDIGRRRPRRSTQQK